MLDGLLLRDAVHRMELLVGDEGAVVLERVQEGDIALYEDLQGLDVDETRGVGDDFGKEALVLLVSPKLGLAVGIAGDDDRLKALDISQHVHVGIETELPFAVLHGGGDDDLEGKVDLAVAFRDVAEAGGHPGRFQGLGGHHFAGILVQDGLHQYKFGAVVVLDPQSVAECLGLLDLRNVNIFSKDERRGRVAALDGGEFPLRSAGPGQRECRCQDSYDYEFGFHLEYVNKAE